MAELLEAVVEQPSELDTVVDDPVSSSSSSPHQELLAISPESPVEGAVPPAPSTISANSHPMSLGAVPVVVEAPTRVSVGIQAAPPDSSSSGEVISAWAKTLDNLIAVAEELHIDHNFSSLSKFVLRSDFGSEVSGLPLTLHDSTCSWKQYYPVLSFLLNGYLHAEYVRMSGMLGLPSCLSTQWHRIVERLEPHVTKLAEWSCGQVRKEIVERGNSKKWVASFDGFYLTRGHYSNNASATMHDFEGGKIAWFTHRTKRGPGHNWEGTSAGAEADMFSDLLGKVKEEGFNISEIITDKDSSSNAIFCRYFPEGRITYCHNHCAKTLHKDLEKIKKNKCEVCNQH